MSLVDERDFAYHRFEKWWRGTDCVECKKNRRFCSLHLPPIRKEKDTVCTERPQLNELVREVITERYYVADKSIFVAKEPSAVWVDWPTEDGWWWQFANGVWWAIYVYKNCTKMRFCGLTNADTVDLSKKNQYGKWCKAVLPTPPVN